ncbi:RagB/SusD family nutrient uptake outer membrane protein [Sphingobacterium pedocola]|nr:RagB/SusD family nutrient uptake outer membrane protein [Sphingobacterium pedocola]
MFDILKRFCWFMCLAGLILSITSCEEYLDTKPDKKLATPATAKDLQAILDNIPRINEAETGLSEIASDNFFLPDANWSALIEVENRDAYLWKRSPVAELYWSYMYRKIYDVNLVLEHIDKVTYQSEGQKNSIYANALLVRGMAFQKLAEVFCVPYRRGVAAEDRLGVVLKRSADINEDLKRSTLEETHNQIKEDLTEAIKYLPDNPYDYPTRAAKGAGYAAMARYLLSIGDYTSAGYYADSSLALKSTLSDYNTVAQIPYPFEFYNVEIIYYSRSYAYRNLSEANARVDPLLYQSYEDDDLRKQLFFKVQADGYYSFIGDYSKANFEKFTGLTTAEMLLIRAECNARAGKLQEAEDDVITLLRKRYVSNFDFTGLDLQRDPDVLLRRIMLERRKELVGRGVRWSDIRRMSFEEDIRLERLLYDTSYVLDQGAIQDFAFLIPEAVIERGGYQQN